MNKNKEQLNKEKNRFISLMNREEPEQNAASVFETEVTDTLNMETVSLSANSTGCPNKSARFNFLIKRIIYSKSVDIFISV